MMTTTNKREQVSRCCWLCEIVGLDGGGGGGVEMNRLCDPKLPSNHEIFQFGGSRGHGTACRLSYSREESESIYCLGWSLPPSPLFFFFFFWNTHTQTRKRQRENSYSTHHAGYTTYAPTHAQGCGFWKQQQQTWPRAL